MKVDIPWTNYFTWWVAAFGLAALARRRRPENKPTFGLLVLVFVVFLLLNVIPWS